MINILEVNAAEPDEFIRTVKALEPTFGGVNLEDSPSASDRNTSSPNRSTPGCC